MNEEAILKSYSPLELVQEMDGEKIRKQTVPPFLIFHGTHDRLVPIKHVRHFVGHLQKVSKNHVFLIEFKVYDGGYSSMQVIIGIDFLHRGLIMLVMALNGMGLI